MHYYNQVGLSYLFLTTRSAVHAQSYIAVGMRAGQCQKVCMCKVFIMDDENGLILECRKIISGGIMSCENSGQR